MKACVAGDREQFLDKNKLKAALKIVAKDY